MSKEQEPFADVRLDGDTLSIPELKWRELLFIGAFKREGATYVRDVSRPLPPFQSAGLFPDDARFEAETIGGRVRLRRAR